MLDYLRIRGLALIDDLSLELSSGMNVLTGETGAGKSIIVDALALLRGGRGRAELVRDGADKARVEAQFALGQRDGRVDEVLGRLELALEDDALVIGRTVNAQGRGRSSLQGRLSTLSCLREIGEVLLDICSQHEHHGLTEVSRHLDLLDHFAQNAELLARYQQRYEQWGQAKSELQRLREQAADRGARIEYLRFVLEELDGVQEFAADYESAKAQLALLRDAQKWSDFASRARASLYEDDRSVWGILSQLLQAARGEHPEGSTLAQLGEELQNAMVAVEDAATSAGRLQQELSADPQLRAQLEEQISELEHLQRKHGCDGATLMLRRDELQNELETLSNVDDRLAALQARVEASFEAAKELGLELQTRRKKAAQRLATSIQGELAALYMPHARLQLRFSPLDAPPLGPRGMDQVEFLFSANPGEALAPLHRVASGGELSRVLLAIKSVLSTGDCVVTYVFDEVDTGVGGAVAEAIGVRLQTTAKERQVLCVTHLPQIAAFAEVHFHVEKVQKDGRTVTRVRRLGYEERVEELARMLGGAAVTDSAREHAKALLRSASPVSDPAGAKLCKERSLGGETKTSSGKRHPKRKAGSNKKVAGRRSAARSN